MLQDALGQRLRGAKIVPADGNPRYQATATGRAGSVLKIQLIIPDDFVDDYYTGFMALDPKAVPLETEKPRAIFVVNKKLTHAYLITDAELSPPDAIDNVIAVNLNTCRYYDFSRMKTRYIQ